MTQASKGTRGLSSASGLRGALEIACAALGTTSEACSELRP